LSVFLAVVPSAPEKDDFLLAYWLAIAPFTDFSIIQSSCVAAYHKDKNSFSISY
ncbi:MAG: hypothetical protein HC815_38000, partial [Richelia sp. RM1_1_1]|nr:hypothetical protein [Richelia sp. RM1_1_1]